MSNMTHIFKLNTETTEHHLISADPNLIITAQGAAGEANAYMASKWGENNHVANFVSGTDKIKVPLEVIQEVKADTAIVKGPLPAAKFGDDTNYDSIIYNSVNGKLFYVAPGATAGESGDGVLLITLDGTPAPTVAAGDIEIV